VTRRLIFPRSLTNFSLASHDHPENAEWLKAAAADLYAALLSNGPHPTPDRLDNHQDLLKK